MVDVTCRTARTVLFSAEAFGRMVPTLDACVSASYWCADVGSGMPHFSCAMHCQHAFTFIGLSCLA